MDRTTDHPLLFQHVHIAPDAVEFPQEVEHKYGEQRQKSGGNDADAWESHDGKLGDF